jgi:hypothetical protein
MASDVFARNHRAVTNADADIATFDSLYCSVAGTAIVTDPDGTVVTYTVPAGVYIWCQGKRVAAASTGTFVALNF